jgi:hypothetical protein
MISSNVEEGISMPVIGIIEGWNPLNRKTPTVFPSSRVTSLLSARMFYPVSGSNRIDCNASDLWISARIFDCRSEGIFS